MIGLEIAFPQIDPVAFSLGGLTIKWYGLAYLAGLLLGAAYIRKLLQTPSLWPNGVAPFPPAVGCATNPATGRRQLILMSEAEELQIGKQSDAEIRKQMGIYADDNLQRYVSGVGMKLVASAHRPNCRGHLRSWTRRRSTRSRYPAATST